MPNFPTFWSFPINNNKMTSNYGWLSFTQNMKLFVPQACSEYGGHLSFTVDLACDFLREREKQKMFRQFNSKQNRKLINYITNYSNSYSIKSLPINQLIFALDVFVFNLLSSHWQFIWQKDSICLISYLISIFKSQIF